MKYTDLNSELALLPVPDRRELFAAPGDSWTIGIDAAKPGDESVTIVSFCGIPVHVSRFVPPGSAFLVDMGVRPIVGPREQPEFDERIECDANTLRWAARLLPPLDAASLLGLGFEPEIKLRQAHRPKYGRGGRRKRARRNGRAR